METEVQTTIQINENGVSNPLGWDGDRQVVVVVSKIVHVSNPLGWDGDRKQDYFYCFSCWFLIH